MVVLSLLAICAGPYNTTPPPSSHNNCFMHTHALFMAQNGAKLKFNTHVLLCEDGGVRSGYVRMKEWLCEDEGVVM